ncbi:hypothetical protein V6N11_080818 [Hibiscus sabdariffa]|uniref:Protein kinase domain-containing protein n=1 Tax=Hibiscus sabdariffa TaxID=183260 RepID=A0ABR2QI08_9ROSI
MNVRVVKIKVLGEGCFGVVHLVKTIAPVYNKVYAMKSADEDHSSSLRKEEEILQQFVDSPNVVRCHGGFTSVERERGVVYNMFMEYASEGSLLSLMRKNGGRIPERDVNCYTRMILEGLFDIHRKGFVHCDLKPGNILVFPPPDGTSLASLKIADFGLAKQVGVSKVKYGFQGSVPYMSPESILGDVTGALDVWSLGCVVVEMITGRLPWDTCDPNDLMFKLFSGESPNIPEDMSILGKDFLQKCFVSDPNQRWSASMLLRHPYLLPEPVLQQSYKASRSSTYSGEEKVFHPGLAQEEKRKEKKRTCASAAKDFRATEYLCNGFQSLLVEIVCLFYWVF